VQGYVIATNGYPIVVKKIDLEKSLQELESIVETLEDGDLSLEQSLKYFEKGVKLSRECQTALKDAEQKVKILTDGELKDFEPAGETPD
jgi:exodeoxyribonuclease VII small subunit